MKRVFVSMMVVVAMMGLQLFGTKVMAANIDEATARQYGTYYLSMMMGGKEADASQVTLAYRFMNEDLNIPAAYVFNVEEQGFVIVSGSDLWYPILGYSTEGLLDTNRMAPSFEWYFESMCNYIRYSQNTGVALISDIAEEWEELKYRKIEVQTVKAAHWMLDNEWGQGDADMPTYNKLCPHKIVNGVEKTAYVGCVATAMSQIMHYWKYPVEPVKDYIGYNCYLDGSYYDYIDIDMSEVTYDYAHMPNKLTSASTEAEIDATALLCYHAGVSVEMSYGLEGSGTQSEKVSDAMRDVFLYDSILKYYARAKNFNGTSETPVYSNDEWVAMLTTEIEAGRPMYYAGFSATGEGRDAGGHAFVCDGKHPTNGKFHFNWGWDGQPNVWSDVRNNNMAAGTYNFKFSQRVITGIQPRGHNAGIEEQEMQLHAAYPNPATSCVTIPYSLKDQNEAVMNVYSIDGRLVERVNINGGENNVTLDVRNYAKGLYVCRLGASVSKFVVR